MEKMLGFAARRLRPMEQPKSRAFVEGDEDSDQEKQVPRGFRAQCLWQANSAGAERRFQLPVLLDNEVGQGPVKTGDQQTQHHTGNFQRNWHRRHT
ncbi:MAG TPA: hypothetical protein VMU24_13935 [Candidatus Acidoferrales bacterium]|nr:hypothetical protein [Candidatus Acidoferrales bacterium]